MVVAWAFSHFRCIIFFLCLKQPTHIFAGTGKAWKFLWKPLLCACELYTALVGWYNMTYLSLCPVGSLKMLAVQAERKCTQFQAQWVFCSQIKRKCEMKMQPAWSVNCHAIEVQLSYDVACYSVHDIIKRLETYLSILHHILLSCQALFIVTW